MMAPNPAQSAKRSPTSFDYLSAFDRNVGWISETEQLRLRDKCVAIAGMGGVGGAYLQTLTRLGVGRFRIADFDEFELANFNRQVGATMATIGRPKVSVMAELAASINPEVQLRLFEHGVDESSLDEFLDGADFLLDGLDFFATPMRRAIFARAAARGIPALTAAPLGMGSTVVYFARRGMTFDRYFRWQNGQTLEKQWVDFLVGLSPARLHESYLADSRRLRLAERRGPSTPMAIGLCAAVAGTEAIRILLDRDPCPAAPNWMQIDLYRRKLVKGRRGGVEPLQALRRRLGYRQLVAKAHQETQTTTTSSEKDPKDLLMRVLEQARWAPSGDNKQPWRFEPLGKERVRVHLSIHDDDVYDVEGEATLLSAGMLLQNMRLAASVHRRGTAWAHRRVGKRAHQLEVDLGRESGIEVSSLAPFIRVRSVDRRPYRLKPLSESECAELEASLNAGMQLRWFRSARDRLRATRVNAQATDIRMRIPEAAEVHARVIDVDHRLSERGIPVEALGVSPAMQALMRRTISRPALAVTLSRVAGTFSTSIEADYLPGMRCGAHFLIAWKKPPAPDDRTSALLRSGEALQRFWRTVTRLGLAMQPSYAPISFARYVDRGLPFTALAGMRQRAEKLRDALRSLWPEHDTNALLFFGRIGTPQTRVPPGRSVRMPLSELMLPQVLAPRLPPDEDHFGDPPSMRRGTL